jgi:hypothetical protein
LLFGKKKTNIMLWVGTDFLFFVGRGCGMKWKKCKSCMVELAVYILNVWELNSKCRHFLLQKLFYLFISRLCSLEMESSWLQTRELMYRREVTEQCKWFRKWTFCPCLYVARKDSYNFFHPPNLFVLWPSGLEEQATIC